MLYADGVLSINIYINKQSEIIQTKASNMLGKARFKNKKTSLHFRQFPESYFWKCSAEG